MINHLYHDDCLDVLQNIPDNSIDLVCIDPPYEISYNNEDWDKGSLDWHKLFQEYYRILKDTGNLVVFQGWSNVSSTKIIGEEYFCLRNWIIWARIKCRGAKTNFGSDREDILWFSKTPTYTFNKIYSNTKKKTSGMGTKNGQLNRSLTNVWYDISPIVPWSPERCAHPTQKPLQLMERIITIFSNEGDLVVDSFCGSGSTCVAAKNLNRKFIGIEKNLEYFNIANQRLTQEIPWSTFNQQFDTE
jgi:site-specific DNA-methyltransferase (adenine-specific)